MLQTLKVNHDSSTQSINPDWIEYGFYLFLFLFTCVINTTLIKQIRKKFHFEKCDFLAFLQHVLKYTDSS